MSQRRFPDLEGTMLAIIEILLALCVISVLVVVMFFIWFWAWDLFKSLLSSGTRTTD
jgi:hypothetical protein